MKNIILFLLLTAMPLFAAAQQKIISGTVKDQNGVLPGAAISKKRVPTNGVIADPDGRFKLTLKGTSHTVIVKLIGFTRAGNKRSGALRHRRGAAAIHPGAG